MACGVFASFLSVFLSLSLFLSFCPCLSVLALLCLSSCLPCLFSCPCGFCRCFLFPCGIYAKRKGARVCPLCPLLSRYVCLYSCVVIEKFCCRCFGFFQFARFVLPTNTTGVGWLARSYFDFLRHYVDITYNTSTFLK